MLFSFSSIAASVVTRRRCRERLHRLVDAEAAGFLARREFLEGREELSDVLLRGHEQKQTIYPPMRVVHADQVAFFERVRAEIEDLRDSKRHERLLPDREALGALFGKDDLPL